MKVITKKILVIALFFINIANLLAENPHPPHPETARSAGSTARGPIVVEGSIEENIIILLLMALLLGMYVVMYKKKKASI